MNVYTVHSRAVRSVDCGPSRIFASATDADAYAEKLRADPGVVAAGLEVLVTEDTVNEPKPRARTGAAPPGQVDLVKLYRNVQDLVEYDWENEEDREKDGYPEVMVILREIRNDLETLGFWR